MGASWSAAQVSCDGGDLGLEFKLQRRLRRSVRMPDGQICSVWSYFLREVSADSTGKPEIAPGGPQAGP
jgi:hypothetical protein